MVRYWEQFSAAFWNTTTRCHSGTVHTVAVAVRVGFVRGDVERADGAAALGIAQFGIAAEPADDHNLIQHSNSLQDAL